jgi:hypothetical protein
MADMAQAVVTGAMGIAGVAIGAGFTYLFGALNRKTPRGERGLNPLV